MTISTKKWLLVGTILLLLATIGALIKSTNTDKQVAEISLQHPQELLNQLAKQSNRAEIFTQLQMLKRTVERNRLALHEHNSYHPELLVASIYLRNALAHLPEALDEVTDCLAIRSAIEYDERTPIEEFEEPIPTLWLVIEKLCLGNNRLD